MFCKKGVLRNFTKFTGKQLCQILVFNKVAGLRPGTLLKKRLWHRCFLPVHFVKFLRTPFLPEHLWWLLLWVVLSIILFTHGLWTKVLLFYRRVLPLQLNWIFIVHLDVPSPFLWRTPKEKWKIDTYALHKPYKAIGYLLIIHKYTLISRRHWLEASQKFCGIAELPVWIDDYSQCIVIRHCKD